MDEHDFENMHTSLCHIETHMAHLASLSQRMVATWVRFTTQLAAISEYIPDEQRNKYLGAFIDMSNIIDEFVEVTGTIMLSVANLTLVIAEMLRLVIEKPRSD